MLYLYLFLLFLALMFILFVEYADTFVQKYLFFPEPMDRNELPPKHAKSVLIDHRLHGHFYNNFPHRPYILFFHGNAGNINCFTYFDELAQHHHLNFLTIDYSGFGSSEGKATTKQIMQDGFDAYDFMIERNIPADQILIMGYSLGGAVATKVAMARKCRGLCLVSTFTSLFDLAPAILTPLRVLTSFFDNIPTIDIIDQIQCPLVVFASRDDYLISWEHGKKLAQKGQGVFLEIQGGHTNPHISHEVFISGLEHFGIKIESEPKPERQKIGNSGLFLLPKF